MNGITFVSVETFRAHSLFMMCQERNLSDPYIAQWEWSDCVELLVVLIECGNRGAVGPRTGGSAPPARRSSETGNGSPQSKWIRA